MIKIKMTANLKDKGLLAGNVYEMTAKEAKEFLDKEQAVKVKKKKVKDGNR